MGHRTKRFRSIALAACLAMVAATTAASAQQQPPAKEPHIVTGLAVMTPTGPATCAAWTHVRLPGANPFNKAAIQYWSEGYLTGLAAGSRHDIIGLFRHEDLVAWMDRYCAANPQTLLQAAINDLGRAMLAHPDGKL
jgi:hypothetical protein